MPVRGLSGKPLWTLVFVVQLVAAGAAAEEQPGWTFWFARDGMQESYSRTLGLTPEGLLAVRHGDLKTMDLLDGYALRSIPEPRATTPADFSRITTSPRKPGLWKTGRSSSTATADGRSAPNRSRDSGW